jgi:hypothetical protein
MSEANLAEVSLSVGETIARYDFFVALDDQLMKDGWDELERLQDRAIFTLRNFILKDFGPNVRTMFDNLVDIQIERLERGSVIGTVTLVLAAGISISDFMNRFDDFHASLRLLKQQLRSIVSAAMLRLMGTTYQYQVQVTLSTTTFKSYAPPEIPVTSRLQQSGFPNLPVLVWYLIASNALLALLLALLLYPAVAHVYFGR